jgi:hypothetical protein
MGSHNRRGLNVYQKYPTHFEGESESIHLIGPVFRDEHPTG